MNEPIVKDFYYQLCFELSLIKDFYYQLCFSHNFDKPRWLFYRSIALACGCVARWYFMCIIGGV